MSKLPSYSNPPVVEVALQVHFKQPENWNVVHLGLFHREIEQYLPKFEAKNVIHVQLEEIDEYPTKSFDIRAMLVDEDQPRARCWYSSEDGHELLQVQHDRLVFNWRKLDDEMAYPRYQSFMRPKLAEYLRLFSQFLETNELGGLEVIQCEAAYVNHIPRGNGWNSVDDLGSILNILGDKLGNEFPHEKDFIHLAQAFTISKPPGRVWVECGILVKENFATALGMKITAKTKPTSSDAEEILKSFDVTHEWIVNAFTAVTSDKMHKLWGREQ